LLNYRADKTIITTDGIGAEHGLTTYHHQEIDVKRLMIERSNEVIVVADHSKIGKEGFSNITGISSIDVIVTGKCGENNAELEALREKSVVVREV
jgi:DeoR/GlpR family transcriptional regulator of sugar metabolism